MDSGIIKDRVFAAFVIVVGIVLITSIQGIVESEIHSSDITKSLLYIPDHRVLHILALGDDAFAADLLWLRSVFYIAANDLEEKQEEHYKDLRTKSLANVDSSRVANPTSTDFQNNATMHSMFFWNLNSNDLPQLLTLAETVTDLDPQFVTPYIQGAMNLGLYAGRYEEAMKLIDKGVANCPNSWEPLYYRGFLKLFIKNDRTGAAVDVTSAARKPHAPTIVIQLAAALTVGAGEREQALSFLQSLREVTVDDQLRKKIDDMLNVYGNKLKVEPEIKSNDIGRKLGSILQQSTGK